MRKVSRTFRIPSDLVDRFDQAAEYAEVDKTVVVVNAIEKFVEGVEQKMENEKVRYALLEVTQFKMGAPPAIIREEHMDEYLTDFIEGSKDEVINEAVERDARYIHYFTREQDEYDNITYRYERTVSNDQFKFDEEYRPHTSM